MLKRITKEELEKLADGLNPKFVNDNWGDFETIIVLLSNELLAYRKIIGKQKNERGKMKKTVFDDLEYVQKAVLGFMGYDPLLYHKPGSFFCSLIDACMRADKNNIERLKLGFPVVVGAVRAYQTGEDLGKYCIIESCLKIQ